MREHKNGAENTHSLPHKDKHFQAQFRRAFEGFRQQPKTMKELSVSTGIDRANICRYVRVMRKTKSIAVVKKTYCSITKHLANKYTTDPAKFPIDPQLKLPL